jgi:ribonuclease VapC
VSTPTVAIDASALVAIAIREDDATDFAGVLATHACLVGAPTLFEAYMVITKGAGQTAAAELMTILTGFDIAIVPFGEAEYRLATQAFDRFGRGAKHPAKLNFGDCLSYAVAKSRGIGLLYKGGDFARTDVKNARRRR